MRDEIKVEDVISKLNLKPLPGEGGFFAETYRSEKTLDVDDGTRHLGTAIFYLVSSGNFSALHRLRFDEVFHFYLGDPVEMLQIDNHGEATKLILGSDIFDGHSLQAVVAAGIWQGTRLLSGRRGWALLGTTMAPGFDFRDFELGDRAGLISAFPHLVEDIRIYTR